MARYQARALRIRDAEGTPDDEARILVDRVWPRGVSKQQANLDRWLRDIAPSTELRKWYNHDREKWNEFRTHYRAEIDNSAEASEAWQWLQDLVAEQAVVLLTQSRDVDYSQAAVLADRLNRMQ